MRHTRNSLLEQIEAAKAAGSETDVELLELALDGLRSRSGRYRQHVNHGEPVSLYTRWRRLEEHLDADCYPGTPEAYTKEAFEDLRAALDPEIVERDGQRGLWIDCPLCGAAHFDTTFERDSEICDKCKPIVHSYSVTFPQWSTQLKIFRGELSLTVRNSDLKNVASHLEGVAGWMRQQWRQKNDSGAASTDHE